MSDDRIGFRAVRVLPDGLADVDHDGDVDHRDLAGVDVCMAGPDAGPIPGCSAFDLDLDGDVDLIDLSIFTNAFTGSSE